MAGRESVAGRSKQRSDTEDEKKEEEQQVPKSNENTSGSSSSTSTDSEYEMGRRLQLELDERAGGIPLLGLSLDKNSVIRSSKTGVFIRESPVEAAVKPKASGTKATDEPKAKRGRSRRSFGVNSNYRLRSKGMVVDAASETNADRRRKRKEEETDDNQGPVADSEKVCKKTKKEPNKDNDDGTDDDDGTVGGAHTNVPSVDLEIAAGN